jgi:hypothetical protein
MESIQNHISFAEGNIFYLILVEYCKVFAIKFRWNTYNLTSGRTINRDMIGKCLAQPPVPCWRWGGGGGRRHALFVCVMEAVKVVVM